MSQDQPCPARCNPLAEAGQLQYSPAPYPPGAVIAGPDIEMAGAISICR
jgi:hypothetical protein